MENQASQGATRRQRPTLLIGLGGTGKQVLLNLRRMFYERFGTVTLPHVSHLWVDTDTRNVTLDGKPMDFLMREVDFIESEKLSTELRKDDLRNYYDHPEAHPEVFSWFDTRLTALQEIRDGAGGIRSFGRLSFFCHYENIMTKLREKKEELQRAVSHNLGRDNYGIEVDSAEVEFWLIFSVAGGTGAGMFLDMAFALKSQLSAANIRGVIVLPSVFSNDFQQRPFGNGYAALMELEHYSAVKDEDGGNFGQGMHAFHAAWTRESYERRSNLVRGPVFDALYLIGNQSYDGRGKLTLEDKNALCQMIAEMLYIEYSPGAEANTLASEVRSSRVNFNVALNRKYSYPNQHDGLKFSEPFCCRYSSFGLSKLFIPIHRIEAAIFYRLARDIIEYWTREQTIPANLDEQLERTWLHQLGANNDVRYRDFYRALESAGEGRTLGQQLRQMLWGERRNRILGTSESSAMRVGIVRWQEDLIADQLDNSSALRGRWGAMAQSIAQNQDTHAEFVMARLDELVIELLATPGQRFDTAREVLRRIRDRLLKDKETFERAAQNSRNASGSANRGAQDRLQWLDGLKRGFTRQVVAEVALEEVEQRLGKELQAQILTGCAALAVRIANAIGVGQTSTDAEGNEVVVETGLIKQLADYRKTLRTAVIPVLTDRYQALKRGEPSPINQDLSQGDAEIDRYYVDNFGKPVVEDTLAEWEQQFFEESEASEPKNLWALRRTLESDGPQAITKRLVAFARNRMMHLERSTVDVLERLGDRYAPGSDDYRAAVDKLLGYARPYLAKPTHFADKQDENPQLKRESWVAASGGLNQTHLKSFSDTLGKMSQRGSKLVGSSPDRVYAYSEVAGLPLMVIPDLDHYRNDAYFPMLERGEVLHTDLQFEKFRDLMIMDKKEVVAHIEALRTLLKGILLGVVRAKQEVMEDSGDVIGYLYRMTDGGLFEKLVDLGPFSLATRRIARTGERDLRESLQADINRMITNMDNDMALQWYALLSFHASHDDSFFRRFSREHIVRVLLDNEAQAVRQAHQIDNEVARTELDNLKFWALEHPRKSGLYIYNPN
jgi:hypothetical protein